MNYAKAKELAAAHAPDLIVGADNGQPHIDLRKTENGQPFSIMLPRSTAAVPMTDAEQEKMMIDSINSAKDHLA